MDGSTVPDRQAYFDEEEDTENILRKVMKESSGSKSASSSAPNTRPKTIVASADCDLKISAIAKQMKPRSAEEKHIDDLLFSSDEDERESVRQQRAIYKNFLAGQLPETPSSLPLCAEEHIVTQENEEPATASPPKNRTITIIIEDFSFSSSYVLAQVGDIVVFQLSDSIPGHAEHLLEGDSISPELCFQSPVMSTDSSKAFSFCLRKPGDLTVCCLIYADMCLLIKVAPLGPYSSAADAYASSTGSFYDSDDVLEDDDPDYMMDLDEADFAPEQSMGRIHKICVYEYSFKPATLSCRSGDAVVFELFDDIDPENMAIACDGEFGLLRFLPIVTQLGTVHVCRHVFRADGVFEVRHAGKSYVACHIMVTSVVTKPVFHVPARVADTVDCSSLDADDDEDDEDDEEEEQRLCKEIRATVRSQSASNSPSDKRPLSSRTPLLHEQREGDRAKPMMLYGSFVATSSPPKSGGAESVSLLRKEFHEQSADIAMNVDSDDLAEDHDSSKPCNGSGLSKMAKKRRNQRKKKKSPDVQRGVEQKPAPVTAASCVVSDHEHDREVCPDISAGSYAELLPPPLSIDDDTEPQDASDELDNELEEAVTDHLPPPFGDQSSRAASAPQVLQPSVAFFEDMDEATLQALLSEDWAADLRVAYGLKPLKEDFVTVTKKKAKGDKEKDRSEVKPTTPTPKTAQRLVEKGKVVERPMRKEATADQTKCTENYPMVEVPESQSPLPSRRPASPTALLNAESCAEVPKASVVIVVTNGDLPCSSKAITTAVAARGPVQSTESSGALSPLFTKRGFMKNQDFIQYTAPPPPSILPSRAPVQCRGDSPSRSLRPVQSDTVQEHTLVNDPEEKRRTLLNVLGLRHLFSSGPAQDWSLSASPMSDERALEQYLLEEDQLSEPKSDSDSVAMDEADTVAEEELSPTDHFLIDRYHRIIALLESGSMDHLRNGKEVPVYRWTEHGAVPEASLAVGRQAEAQRLEHIESDLDPKAMHDVPVPSVSILAANALLADSAAPAALSKPAKTKIRRKSLSKEPEESSHPHPADRQRSPDLSNERPPVRRHSKQHKKLHETPSRPGALPQASVVGPIPTSGADPAKSPAQLRPNRRNRTNPVKAV